MQTGSYIIKCWALCAFLVFMGGVASAQDPGVQARQLMTEKKYDQALDIYSGLYNQFPDSLYTEYFKALITAQKYKVAEKVVEKQMGRNKDPLMHVDLGVVYDKQKKDSKAKEQFDGVVQLVNGDMILTDRIVKAFTAAEKDDYALKTYERATQLLGAPYFYSRQMAVLYAKVDDLDKAVDAVLAGAPGQFVNIENSKTQLLEILGTSPKKLQLAQKAIIKKINEQPENIHFAELLTWIYTQKDDWDGALIQIRAIDERNKEGGKRLIDLAHVAANAKQYDVAVKAYDEVIEQGKELPYYATAKSEKLNVAFARLKNNPAFTQAEVSELIRQYEEFLAEFPKYYSAQTAADYANVNALYGNNVQKGIDILQKALNEPDTRRNTAGAFKLQLGDYYVLAGKMWDASLTYSQVDKEFRQDAMGEDARFRNSKLAYYRGDFDWAQKQLSILKSATSDLIANDAIYLSVLITENVEDSNFVPLERFAYAGLLLFQNRDSVAEKLLDSLTKTYPKHPLNDDIIMLRADIAFKHHEYAKAVDYLKSIVELYGKDVLGDDAVYKLAEIHFNNLGKKDLGKNYYEQLIIDYPGSTYVQAARLKLYEINNPITQ
ncbi:MAG: tetratricopeptide repeat protein [Bacteroidota bacterium]